MTHSVKTFLLSAYFWFELFATAALLFPVAFLIWLGTVWFDKRLLLLHQFSCFWSNLVYALNPLWRVRIKGKEKVNRKETYIIVSNHQSGADILVLFTLRVHYKWIAKRSLFFFPFMGWNMTLSRYIALDRAKKSSMIRMLKKSGQAIREGNSLMIFPEGTRSKDGKIQSFKTGAFHLAIEHAIPVLPIAIKGTNKAIQKGGLLVYKNYDIQVHILDPILPEYFQTMTSKELAMEVHNRIKRELES